MKEGETGKVIPIEKGEIERLKVFEADAKKHFAAIMDNLDFVSNVETEVGGLLEDELTKPNVEKNEELIDLLSEKLEVARNLVDQVLKEMTEMDEFLKKVKGRIAELSEKAEEKMKEVNNILEKDHEHGTTPKSN